MVLILFGSDSIFFFFFLFYYVSSRIVFAKSQGTYHKRNIRNTLLLTTTYTVILPLAIILLWSLSCLIIYLFDFYVYIYHRYNLWLPLNFFLNVWELAFSYIRFLLFSFRDIQFFLLRLYLCRRFCISLRLFSCSIITAGCFQNFSFI